MSAHTTPQGSHHSGLSNLSQGGGGQGGGGGGGGGGGPGTGGSKRVSMSLPGTSAGASPGPSPNASGHGLLPSPTKGQGPASPSPYPAAGKDSPAWGAATVAPGQGPPLPGIKYQYTHPINKFIQHIRSTHPANTLYLYITISTSLNRTTNTNSQYHF